MRGWIIIFLAIFKVLASACDLALIAKRDESSFIPYKDQGGGRCEGDLRKPTADSGTYLVASFASMGGFNPAKTDALRVSWGTLAGQLLHITARSTRNGYFYRMDVDVPGNSGTYSWPTNVMARTNLQSTELGIVAFYLDQGKRLVYVPLSVQPSASAPSSLYRLILAHPHQLSSLSVLFKKIMPTGTVARESSRFSAESLASQGDEHGIPINIPARDLQAGLFQVTVQGQLLKGAPAADTFFAHVPANSSGGNGANTSDKRHAGKIKD